jgi:hypothetical protein
MIGIAIGRALARDTASTAASCGAMTNVTSYTAKDLSVA